jgi:hypothetical protein
MGHDFQAADDRQLVRFQGGELRMLHITGFESIVLPHVKQKIVSNVIPLRTPAAGQQYQRELVFVTDMGALKLTLIADDRETLAFAAE